MTRRTFLAPRDRWLSYDEARAVVRAKGKHDPANARRLQDKENATHRRRCDRVLTFKRAAKRPYEKPIVVMLAREKPEQLAELRGLDWALVDADMLDDFLQEALR